MINGTIKSKLPHATIATGAALIGLSQATGSITQAAAGVALIAAGGCARAKGLIQQAIRDTTRERDKLAQDQEAAQESHTKWLVARALLDKEAEHLCLQMANLERDVAERMTAEREQLMAEVEQQKLQIKQEGFWIGYDAGQRGILSPETHPAMGATVIPMPLRPIGSDATAAGKGNKS